MQKKYFSFLVVLFLATIVNVSAQTPITDANIHEAVDLWVSDQPTAETTYGHINNWDTSNITDMSSLFSGKTSFNENIGNWDVSNVSNMSGMFKNAYNFNKPIGSWDVSSVTNMSNLFSTSSNVLTAFNQPLSAWDVSNVTNMFRMFQGASSFNQPIGNWNVSSVTNMSRMFQGVWDSTDQDFQSSPFNQDISSWDVSNVTNMTGMFRNSDFNQSIENWDTSSIISMSEMFSASQFNQDIGSWNVSSVTNMSGMFEGATLSTSNYDSLLNGWASLPTLQPSVNFSGGSSTYCNGESGRNILINTYNWIIEEDGGLDCASITPLTDANIQGAVNLWVSDQTSAEATYGHISNWDTSNITDMSSLFRRKSFNEPIGSWDVSNVTNMYKMFEESSFNQPIGDWDVSSVTGMDGMFSGRDYVPDRSSGAVMKVPDSQFNQDIGSWDVSSVTSMGGMFAFSQFNQDIGSWDVSNVRTMNQMFSFSQFNQNIGNWDVSNVRNMYYTFAYSQFNQDIGSWDVSSVIDMEHMFAGATSFNQPIGNWDVGNVILMNSMFSGQFSEPTSFNQPIGNWDVTSVFEMWDMFHGATAFNQPIGNWDVSNVEEMGHMFHGAIAFNQPLGSWDVISDMDGMFQDATSFSTENYDNLLIGWASKTLPPNRSFDAPSTSYCNGETARDYIINTYGWTINDAGKDCTNAAINCLTVEDANGFLGISNNINLSLESSEIIKGFQFDITFPDGFVFDPNDITKNGLPENFQVSCANVGGNAYRVVGFSLTNETIAAGTASIISFPTLINEGTLAGEYPIPVTNVTLSDVNNVDIASLCLTDGTITVYSYPMGDANGDDAVNILDILGTVDYIFDNPPALFYFELADVNADATINILDVLGIQDIILNPAAKPDDGTKVNTAKSLAGNNYLNITNAMFSPNTSETIEINLANDDIVKGLQFDFVLPDGFTLNTADIVGSSRLDGFTVRAEEISRNTYKVLVFSLSSATVAPGTGVNLNLPVFIEPDVSIAVYPVVLNNVIISNTNNTDISTQASKIGEITISTLGIDDFEDHENTFTLYPNPVNETLYVKINRKSSYSIFDVYGKLLQTGKVNQGENELDLKHYQTGIYFLQIKNDLGYVTKKVIKE